MKKSYLKFVSGTALAMMFLLASCHSACEVTKVEGRMQPMDSTYDVNPDTEAMALLAPYKAKIDSMMYRVTEGAVTCGNIYEILPFENSLCVVTLKGVYLNHLFENIAARGGEGVSGVQLQITKDGKLLRAAVAGKPVVDDKLYTVATIDYLADGNDGMTALIQGEKRDCPPGATLRGLFMDYVERQTAAGKKITSRMEGRITVED